MITMKEVVSWLRLRCDNVDCQYGDQLALGAADVNSVAAAHFDACPDSRQIDVTDWEQGDSAPVLYTKFRFPPKE